MYFAAHKDEYMSNSALTQAYKGYIIIQSLIELEKLMDIKLEAFAAQCAAGVIAASRQDRQNGLGCVEIKYQLDELSPMAIHYLFNEISRILRTNSPFAPTVPASHMHITGEEKVRITIHRPSFMCSECFD